ncbi:hypothetical protein HRH25_12725 [Flavisolibacter sp. BT320]|nr:hypothetical protein [Flavisolibacter longurius]
MAAKKFRHKHNACCTMPSFIALLLCRQPRRLTVGLSFFLFFLLNLKIFKAMKNANHYFGSSMGSENFYRQNLTKVLYTDGVKEMAEGCQAYWLIDLIISHQTNRTVSVEPFQVWDLNRVEGERFQIVCNDGKGKDLASQEITYSDFPYDLATIWLVDGCLMLPKEY